MNNEYYPDRRSGSSFTAFLLGAAVGAVAALLFAPAAGAETRAKMKKFTKDATREARKRFEQGREKFGRVVEDVEEALEPEVGSSASQNSRLSQEDKYDH
ncbi:MAG TPA: YtxH domain-containing protein [Candidatus Polarisedimenticolia bacterium]|jgi:gas vesicle protein|nr:YtxH domain-containing protein [Candidatus Polarisedimenticolia bacterium]